MSSLAEFERGKAMLLEAAKEEGGTIASWHNHLGGSLDLTDAYQMGVRRGIRGVHGTCSDFISRIVRTRDNTGSLDSYVAVLHETLEIIQAGPTAVHDTVGMVATYLHGNEGILNYGTSFGDGMSRAFVVGDIEIRYNPMKRTGAHHEGRGRKQGMFDADHVIWAANNACGEIGIAGRGQLDVKLISCFARDLDFEVNISLANKIAEARRFSSNYVGVDVAGPENPKTGCNFSIERDLTQMAECFDVAAGDPSDPTSLGRTVHNGETAHTNVDIFCMVIDALRPHRLAHPIAAFRGLQSGDDRGFRMLADRKILVELCIYSNLLTGALTDWTDVKELLLALDRYCIPYSFSSDSCCLQGSTLAGEFAMLLGHGSLTQEQLRRSFRIGKEGLFSQRRKRVA